MPPDRRTTTSTYPPAQVRRCELVSGDRVAAPVRPPRRSERYPSLIRVDTINGAPPEEVAAATPFDDLPAVWPAERIALDADDPTLKAIEWLTPIGRGSRVTIVGHRAGGQERGAAPPGRRAGRSRGASRSPRCWPRPARGGGRVQAGPLQPVAALTFAASADAQSQAVEARDRRWQARGGAEAATPSCLVDGLDGVKPGRGPQGAGRGPQPRAPIRDR
jgi:transcription termination factor Rho